MRGRTILLILSPILIVIISLTLLIGILQSAGMMTLNFAASLVEVGVPLEVARFAQDVTVFLNAINLPLRLLFIPIIFIIAFIIHRFNHTLAKWLLESPAVHAVRKPKLIFEDDPQQNRIQDLTPDKARHRQTLEHLIASAISLIAFSLAAFLSLLQFINPAGLALVATVASTALGFGARDYINDLIMGVTDMFEDDFNVGEKIEVLRILHHLEGVVSKVNIRTATILTPDGIPIIIPHGDMRVILNFSRGHHSSTSITFLVDSASFSETLSSLRELSAESMALFPDLIEPLKIISKSGVIGSEVELNILGKASYGLGADLRLQLLTEIEKRIQI